MPSTWIELEVTRSESHKHLWAQICKVDNPHVTLAFLGSEVTDLQAERVAALMRRWLLNLRLEQVDLWHASDGFDCFAGNAAVLKLRRDSKLFRYQKALVNLLDGEEDLLVDKTYNFTPHVTVGYNGYTIPNPEPKKIQVETYNLRLMHKSNPAVVIPLP